MVNDGELGENYIIYVVFHWNVVALQWRHNDHDGVSNHQPHGCLLNRLFGRRSKKNIKAPRQWPLCREFTGAGEFPAQRASNAENVSIWWRLIEISIKDRIGKGNGLAPNNNRLGTLHIQYVTQMIYQSGWNLSYRREIQPNCRHGAVKVISSLTLRREMIHTTQSAQLSE